MSAFSILALVSVAVASSPPQAARQSHLTAALIRKLSTRFPEQPHHVIEATVADSIEAAALAEAVPIDAVLCDVDFDAPCPTGWADAGDGQTCLAPSYYKGPCAKQIEYGSLTLRDRLQQTIDCGADFACIGSCEEDFRFSCPIGWELDQTNACVAPADYAGPCVPMKRFEAETVPEKIEWGASCGVRWPCRAPLQRAVQQLSCIQNATAFCPHGWKRAENRCHAPVSYNGPCSQALAPEGYTLAMKEAWASACMTCWGYAAK